MEADTWYIQLTITIDFISSECNDKERVVHSKSDNIEITINDEADKVIEGLLLIKSLETLVTGSNFIFYCVHLLYYKCHKLILNCGGSYIHSPD